MPSSTVAVAVTVPMSSVRAPSPCPGPAPSSSSGSPSPAPAPAPHVRPTFIHSSTSYGAKHHPHPQPKPPAQRHVHAHANAHVQRHHSSSSSSSASGSGSGSTVQSLSHGYGGRRLESDEGTGTGAPTRYSDYPECTKESYPPSDRPYPHSHSRSHHIHMPDTVAVVANHQRGRSTPAPRSPAELWERAKGACSCSGEGGLGKGMMLGWIVTTVLVLLLLACYRGQLFQALDDLSKTLSSQGLQGQLTIFLLILITTIPPFPLYSTLIVLSGYTFGAWHGFVVSYAASLVGAILVFVISRGWLKDIITKSLASSPTSISLLNLLPANPHLLLLIRIAPYPYNLLNVILASSPSLTLRTYTGCTAISLCKLILHTWIGAGIHDLSASYGHGHDADPSGDKSVLGDLEDGAGVSKGDGKWPWPSSPSSPTIHHGDHGPPGHTHGHAHGQGHPPMEANREDVKLYTTWAGIILCVALFFYLTHLAKRALRRAQAEQAEQDEREREMREGGDGVGVRLLGGEGRLSEQV